MNNSKFLTALGARIKELRVAREMTQNDLATQCDFEKASMSRIEAGKTNITILTLHKISTALDIEITEFFRTDGQITP
jgi:transcriptional regulator with XRE-family HTH domain